MFTFACFFTNGVMTDIKQWFCDSSREHIIVAGPCSAESEEQVMSTATALAAMPEVKLFRAGVWKPRTRPDSFEGKGEEALTWLEKVSHATGMPTLVEVATPTHVELCLKYGVSAVWVGARTVVNPFSVQQLADALRGTQMPVFVKNPVTPDLKLWLGAFERFQKAGLSYLAAIHRGFQHFAQQPYRNYPMWEMAMELTRVTGLPVITDVSHICGCRDLIADMAQKAADMATDGLMIEVHPAPDKALSDARQQITPAQLKQLLQNLKWRSKSSIDDSELVGLRAEIDDVDSEMLRLLSHRMELSRRIGQLKKQKGITAFQPDRWKKVLSDHIEASKSLNLNEDLVTEVFETIHKASVEVQTDILGEDFQPQF